MQRDEPTTRRPPTNPPHTSAHHTHSHSVPLPLHRGRSARLRSGKARRWPWHWQWPRAADGLLCRPHILQLDAPGVRGEVAVVVVGWKDEENGERAVEDSRRGIELALDMRVRPVLHDALVALRSDTLVQCGCFMAAAQHAREACADGIHRPRPLPALCGAARHCQPWAAIRVVSN